jgi:hypothetical protein
MLKSQLEGKVFETPICLTFVLWRKDRRKGDRANVLCVQEKMLCDALVFYKCIPDDNDKYIHSSMYFTGGIDKENPRVDCLIESKKTSACANVSLY